MRPRRQSLSPVHPPAAAAGVAPSSLPALAVVVAPCSAASLASGGSMRPPHALYPSVMTGRRALHAGCFADGYSDSTSNTACSADGLSSAFAIAQPAHASARASLSHDDCIHAGRFPVASRWWPRSCAKMPSVPAGP